MRRRFRLLMLALLATVFLLTLTACGASKYAGVYSVSPGLFSFLNQEEWTLGEDGTAVAVVYFGGDITERYYFDYTVKNGKFIATNSSGEFVSVPISNNKDGLNLTVEVADSSYDVTLTRKSAGPKTAYNKNPDPNKIIGQYSGASDNNIYENFNDRIFNFTQEGIFEYNYNGVQRLQCPYTINGNKLTLDMSNLTNYTYNAIDDLDLDLNSAKTVFTYTFDYEDNDIVIFNTGSSSVGPLNTGEKIVKTSDTPTVSSLPPGIVGYVTVISDNAKVEHHFSGRILNSWNERIPSNGQRPVYNNYIEPGKTYIVYDINHVDLSRRDSFDRTYDATWYEIFHNTDTNKASDGSWIASQFVSFSNNVSGNNQALSFERYNNPSGNNNGQGQSNSPSGGQSSGNTGWVTVLINDLNIRTQPNTSAKIKGLAKQYKEYEVYNMTTADGYTWYQIGTDEWIADDGSWVSFSKERKGSTDKPITPYEEFFGDWKLFYKDSGHYYSSNSSSLQINKDGTWIKMGIGGNWKSISNDTLALLLDENGDGKTDYTYQVRLFTIYHENELDNKNTLSPYEPGTGDTPFCMLTEENGEYYYYTKPDKSAQTPVPANAVYVSIYHNNSFVKAKDGSPVDKYPVVVPQNGATIKDIIIMVHKALCQDGENGCAFETNAYGEAITKLWGIDNGGYYFYYVDEALANTVNDVVTPLSFLDLFIE